MASGKESKKSPQNRKRRISRMGRRFFFLAVFFIVGGFGLLSAFGENGFTELLHLQTLHVSLQHENQALLQEQEELKAEIARLNDPRYVEFVARERLGLMRENEVFVVFEQKLDESTVDKSPPPNIPPAR